MKPYMKPVDSTIQKPVIVLKETPKPTQIISTESIRMEPIKQEPPQMIDLSPFEKANLDTAIKERLTRFERLKEDVLNLEKHLSQMYNLKIPLSRIGRRRIRRKAHEVPRKFPCIFETCKRSYSCRSALRVHLKRIHQTILPKEN